MPTEALIILPGARRTWSWCFGWIAKLSPLLSKCLDALGVYAALALLLCADTNKLQNTFKCWMSSAGYSTWWERLSGIQYSTEYFKSIDINYPIATIEHKNNRVLTFSIQPQPDRCDGHSDPHSHWVCPTNWWMTNVARTCSSVSSRGRIGQIGQRGQISLNLQTQCHLPDHSLKKNTVKGLALAECHRFLQEQYVVERHCKFVIVRRTNHVVVKKCFSARPKPCYYLSGDCSIESSDSVVKKWHIERHREIQKLRPHCSHRATRSARLVLLPAVWIVHGP